MAKRLRKQLERLEARIKGYEKVVAKRRGKPGQFTKPGSMNWKKGV